MVRDTRQREAIRQTLAEARRPLSVSELHQLAQAKVAHLGIATVYRTLKSLHDDDEVVRVELPGRPPRWELAPGPQALGRHHHHFLCLTCNKLYEIDSCPADLQRLLPAGYVLQEHDILLRGQCQSCAQPARLGRKRRG